jgi:hypothetical protein
MAKSYVKTNRKKLDEFFRQGKLINDIGMIVGQLSGKPKYPPGHVGSKSRVRSRAGQHDIGRSPEEKQRRLQINRAKRYLATLPKEARRGELRRLRAQLKGLGMSSRGLGRRKAGAVAVAKVAGVLASRGQYHLRGLKAGQVTITANLDKIRRALLGLGGSVVDGLKAMGSGLKEKIRASFRATGHTDTGKLVRNIQYQIFSIGGKAAVIKAAKEARALARKSKKRRRR